GAAAGAAGADDRRRPRRGGAGRARGGRCAVRAQPERGVARARGGGGRRGRRRWRRRPGRRACGPDRLIRPSGQRVNRPDRAVPVVPSTGGDRPVAVARPRAGAGVGQPMTTYHAELAWVDGRPQPEVLIEIEGGRFTAVTTGVPAPAE